MLKAIGITLVLAALFLYVPFSTSLQNPCISSPLLVTNVKWPSGTNGQKGIGWTTSSTQFIASFTFTSPNVVVFTDTRGCTQTVRR